MHPKHWLTYRERKREREIEREQPRRSQMMIHRCFHCEASALIDLRACFELSRLLEPQSGCWVRRRRQEAAAGSEGGRKRRRWWRLEQEKQWRGGGAWVGGRWMEKMVLVRREVPAPGLLPHQDGCSVTRRRAPPTAAINSSNTSPAWWSQWLGER